MNIGPYLNRKKDKRIYYYDYGRGPGKRPAVGVFPYTKPQNQTQKNHNKQVLDLIEVKKSQTIIERQLIGTAYIPPHKFKANFLEYYEEYVEQNKVDGNRALQNSFTQFKEFIKRDFISPVYYGDTGPAQTEDIGSSSILVKETLSLYYSKPMISLRFRRLKLHLPYI